MTKIRYLTASTDQLEAVIDLWKGNRKTLGPYPRGAFEERLQKREVIVALCGDVVVGYVLFYVAQKGHVRLTHLCIDTDFNGQGIARALVEHLRSKTASQKGIGLHCRRDYDVCNLWPKLGFVPVSEKIGRSKDGHELIFFWLQNSHPTLFKPEADDDRLKVVIDANIFFDIHDAGRNGADETAGLMADWLQPLIQVCINEELFTEIFRDEDATQRKDRLSQARMFECLESNVDDFLSAQQSIRSLLGDPTSKQDASDQRHLSKTIASDATVFVTRDEGVLRVAEDIYQQHGLSVVRPSDLVAQFEELRNEKDYQRARLAGSLLKSGRVSSGATKYAEAFQNQASDEKRRQILDFLNRCFANPDRYECHYAESEEGKPLALHILDTTNPHVVELPVFRISPNVLKTRLALTLTRTLLAGIVENALSRGVTAVKIVDRSMPPVVLTALRSAGFFKLSDSWLKLSIPACLPPTEMSNRVCEIGDLLAIPSSEIQHLTEELEDKEFQQSADRVLAMEHLLWPAKILGCNVNNLVVAIDPRWATDLFDAGLANGCLWGADTELATNPDSVYYRAPKPPVGTSNGRILWYVSADSKIAGVKCIRACSQLTNVTMGRPKDLFRRFKRLGVYEWKHVLDTAGSIDKHLMALEFCNTELFCKTISWNDTQAILQAHGISSTFQSPTRIPEEAFLEIYQIGVGASGKAV